MKNFTKILTSIMLASSLIYCGNTKLSQQNNEDLFLEDGQSESAGKTTGALNPSLTPVSTVSLGDTNATVDEKNHSAFIWKGFQHEWLRTVIGFKIPHRISKFDSYINNEDHQVEGSWTSDATFTFGQSTGVDGNFMKPVGYYGAVNSPGIYTSRGNVSMSWTDNGDGGTYPKAKSVINQTVSIDLNRNILNYGNLDNYAVFLRGIKLDSNCDNAKQPAGETCNSNGMWPYKMYFKIHSCGRSYDTLNCTLTVNVYRAWTPNKGGLPLIEEKPFNDKLDFDLKVYYTVIGGDNGDFKFTEGTEFSRTGKGRDNDAKTGTKTIYGSSGYSTGTAVMTAFGFEFTKFGSKKKNNHLGRYIGKVYFRLKDSYYSSGAGYINYNYYTQVWVPDTVVNTNVTYKMKASLLQFGATGTSVAKGKSAQGSLCINSNGAPFFSKWKKCGSGDKGPARSEHKLQIYAP